MRHSVTMLLFAALLPAVSAAVISGTVYDLGFDAVEDAIVTVDTLPAQKTVAKEGRYEFSLDEGSYTITARAYRNNALVGQAREEVSVKGQGSYVIDLILFPAIDEDVRLYNDSSLEFDEPVIDGSAGLPPWIYYAAAALALVSFVFIGHMLIRRIRKRQALQDGPVADELKDTVMDILKKERRLSQKELRSRLPFSEAKVSLVLAELERDGLLEKLKKGRGNIIILKKVIS